MCILKFLEDEWCYGYSNNYVCCFYRNFIKFDIWNVIVASSSGVRGEWRSLQECSECTGGE